MVISDAGSALEPQQIGVHYNVNSGISFRNDKNEFMNYRIIANEFERQVMNKLL